MTNNTAAQNGHVIQHQGTHTRIFMPHASCSTPVLLCLPDQQRLAALQVVQVVVLHHAAGTTWLHTAARG